MITDTTPSQPTLRITYELADYELTDRTVEVTYTRESDGFVYSRQVNIPHLENGSIDEEYFQEVLEGQLRGVENKQRMGIIEFIDPNASVGIGTIEAPI
jgi:hypothetical protein